MASAARIGSLWLKGEPAMVGEAVVWKRRARRYRGGRRLPVRGKLYLTSERLVFCPNLLAAALGHRTWRTDLAGIRHVGIQPRGPDDFAGASVDRLRIELRDADPELFRIRGLDASVTRIERSLPRPATRRAPAVRVRRANRT